VGSLLLSVPYYLTLEIEESVIEESQEDGSKINATIYRLAFSDLALMKDELLYRFTICLYLIVLKVGPCVVLTALTGLLIHAMYKAEERSAR